MKLFLYYIKKKKILVSRMQVTLLLYSPACSHNWCCILHPSPSAGGGHGRGCVCEVWALCEVWPSVPLHWGQQRRGPSWRSPVWVLCVITWVMWVVIKSQTQRAPKEEPVQNLGSTGMIRKLGTGHLKTCSHYSVYIEIKPNTEVRFQSLYSVQRGSQE